MNFWETEGTSIQQSQIDNILNNDPILESLFKEITFMDEFYSQKPNLIEFLAKSETIRQMIEYIYDIDKITHLTFKQQCDFPFIAFNVLSNVNPTITDALYKDNELLKYLFSISERDMDAYITSQGYFQAIFKNMLSDLNPYMEKFVKLLKSDAESRVFPLIHNLSKANSEIIKDILGNTKEYIKKLQNCIFEYLLFYFLNEQFTDSSIIPEMFENLNDIFTFLRQEGIKYNYKLKYEFTLYSDKYVKNRKYSEEIYIFKLTLLKYIAETRQINRCEKPELFIKSYKNFKSSKKYTFIINSLVEFFRILAANEDFHVTVTADFIFEVLAIIKETEYNDVIHKHIFEILNYLQDILSNDKASTEIIANFLIEAKSNIKLPMEKGGYRNKVSGHFIHGLLSQINMKLLEPKIKETLSQWKDQLNTIFTKLCYDISMRDISNLEESSEVKIIVTDNFKFIGDEKVNENRDHYEDDILEPEPIDSPTKMHVYSNVTNREREKSPKTHSSDSNDMNTSHSKNSDKLNIVNGLRDSSVFKKEQQDTCNELKDDLFSPCQLRPNSFNLEDMPLHNSEFKDSPVKIKVSASQKLVNSENNQEDIFNIGEFDNNKKIDDFDIFNT